MRRRRRPPGSRRSGPTVRVTVHGGREAGAALERVFASEPVGFCSADAAAEVVWWVREFLLSREWVPPIGDDWSVMMAEVPEVEGGVVVMLSGASEVAWIVADELEDAAERHPEWEFVSVSEAERLRVSMAQGG